PGGAQPRLWHGLGCRRLALVSVPDEDRTGRWPEAPGARGLRAQDDLCQPLYQSRVIAGGARAFQPRRLRQARHRREIPDQSEQGWMKSVAPKILIQSDVTNIPELFLRNPDWH